MLQLGMDKITDGGNMKTKTTRKHVDCCHKGCSEVHVMCDIKGCASEGRHFASDHVSVYTRIANAKAEGK